MTTTIYKVGDAVGTREDLTDMIYNISPTMTPFMNAIGKTKAKNVRHDWQTDSLAQPDLNNAHIEGDDISSFDASQPSVRLDNYCQISMKTLAISDRLEAVDKAGRKSEVAYQLAKRMKELKRDMECILLNNQAASNGAPPKLGGLEAWLCSNVDHASDGLNPTAADGTHTRTAGTKRALAETQLLNVLSSAFDASGEIPTIALASSSQKQTISKFNGGTTRFNQAEDGKLYASIDVYVSDFGEVKIVPSPLRKGASTLPIINPDYWAVAYLQGVQVKDVAKAGPSEKKYILADYTLESRNEAASALIADLL